MRVLGLDIGGNSMTLVLLEADKNGWRILDSDVRKKELKTPDDQDELKLFRKSFQDLVTALAVDVVAVKARPESGTYAASGTSFKIEGLVQLAEGPKVIILSPNTIAAVLKKHPVTIPADLYKYQHSAFKAAYCYLMQ